MQHLVSISVAPVVVVLDDRANPIQLFAVPLSFVVWLPCWLYAALSSAPGWLSIPPRRLSGWLGDWTGDLALMAEATRLLLLGRWVFWGPI